MAVTHVLFDFFGTLVDYSPSRTEQGYPRSFALLRGAGCALGYEEFLGLWCEISEGFDAGAERTHREFAMVEVASAFLRRALAEIPDGLAGAFAATYVAEWSRGVRYRAEVPALLERLAKRFTLAIVTNTHDAELVPGHLDRMGVRHRFARVVTSVEHGTRKPAPAIFEHAVRTLGTSADHCVYVGDTYEADYRGARGAGIRALLIDPRGLAPIPEGDRLGSVLDLEDRLLRVEQEPADLLERVRASQAHPR
jgi:putative hydrolase of the HAD superfamily